MRKNVAARNLIIMAMFILGIASPGAEVKAFHTTSGLPSSGSSHASSIGPTPASAQALPYSRPTQTEPSRPLASNRVFLPLVVTAGTPATPYAVRYTTPHALTPLAKEAILKALQHWAKTPPANGVFYLVGLRQADSWAVATMTAANLDKPLPKGEESHISMDNLFALLLVQTSTGWTAAIEGDEHLQELLKLVPDSELSSTAKEAIFPPGVPFPRPEAQPEQAYGNYKFPWHAGEQWRLTKGWHDAYTWSGRFPANTSLDFDKVGPAGTNADILASAPGTVTYKCDDKTQVFLAIMTDGTGESLGYLHLDPSSVVGEGIDSGTHVNQGRKLGRMKDSDGQDLSTTCGRTVGTHIHINFPEKPFTMDGKTFTQDYVHSGEDLYSSQGGGTPCSGPSLNSPNDGETLSSRGITFSWNGVGGCTFNGYTFRVKDTSDMDNGGTTIVDTGEGGTSHHVDFESRWDDHDLYWGVRAANAPNGANWSTRHFRIHIPQPTGWHIEYFSDKNLGGRCFDGYEDSTYIFKAWSGGAPVGGCPVDTFSARFTRKVNFPGGDYRFHCQHDDGCRISIDGQTRVDAWWNSSFDGHDWGGSLSAGDHEIKVEYYDDSGDARLEAWWQGPGFLPRDQACDSSQDQWCGEYWGNSGLSGTPALRFNEGSGELNHSWNNGGPADGFPPDNFSARWQRTATFECGRYRFTVHSDDGVRLWMGTQQLLDEWRTQVASFQPEVDVPAGNSMIKVEYYDGGGGASLGVNWQKLSSCPEIPAVPNLNSPVDGTVLNAGQSITLSWNPVTGATEYYAEIMGGATGTQNSGWQSGTTWTVSSLAAGYSYTWHVKARNGAGASSFSDPRGFTIQGAPDAPTLSSPANGSTQPPASDVSLTWNSVVGATDYQAESWVTVDTTHYSCNWTTTTSCHRGRLPGGYTYSWHVKARNSAGESPWSDPWTFTTKLDRPAPAAIDMLVTPKSCSQVDVGWRIYSWDKTTGGEGMRIYRNGAPVGEVGPMDWMFHDENLSENTRYSYYVTAFRGNVESDPSATVTVTTPPCLSDTRLFPDPSSTTVSTGQVFTVDLNVDVGTHTADTVDAYFDFDPNYLEVVDSTGAPTTAIELNLTLFGDATTNEVDNAGGHINISVSQMSSPYLTGVLRVATVRLRAKAAVASTGLKFIQTGARQSDLLRGGVSLHPVLTDSTIAISPSIELTGHIVVQARGSVGTNRWITPLFRMNNTTKLDGITIYRAGTNTILTTGSATTGNSGHFSVTITSLPAGTYDIQLKAANTLSVRKANVVLPSPTEVDFGTLLVGDSTGDDLVNGGDVSYMIPAFLHGTGDPEFRPYADTNADGVINGADVSALIPNFLQVGPTNGTAPGVNRNDAPRPAAAPRLLISPLSQQVRVGQVFTTSIAVDLGTGLADTVDAYLDFDPQVLEVVDANGAPATALTLNPAAFSAATYNKIDNAAGHIDLSASRFTKPPLNGALTVATIRFRMKSAATTASIRFARAGSRHSDLLLGGATLAPDPMDGTMTVAGAEHRLYLPVVRH